VGSLRDCTWILAWEDFVSPRSHTSPATTLMGRCACLWNAAAFGGIPVARVAVAPGECVTRNGGRGPICHGRSIA
jgi:hypothetical protein